MLPLLALAPYAPAAVAGIGALANGIDFYWESTKEGLVPIDTFVDNRSFFRKAYNFPTTIIGRARLREIRRMAKADVLLAEAIGKTYDDPLAYVMLVFPWDTDPDRQ